MHYMQQLQYLELRGVRLSLGDRLNNFAENFPFITFKTCLTQTHRFDFATHCTNLLQYT